ncbi:hypothetical protein [Acinetobacter brisouii]|uniref:hypothetical protein n=1 Tax=Acinetobacter brisouii TaxID=396323 RepID=UPI00124F04F5|nr:hypothetical protein [Acinetobacter brisouii]
MLSNLPKKLNPKQMHFNDDIKRVILEGRPFTFDEFVKFKDEYSGGVPVEYSCVDCGAACRLPFKKLLRRKIASRATCPTCSVKEVASTSEWRETNREAQLKVQSLSSVRKKNSESVSKFWRENPQKKAEMVKSLKATYQTEETKERIRNRKTHSGTGVSGVYDSKFGQLRFDSCYELGFIAEMEKRVEVKEISRGPTIDYTFNGSSHQYMIDFLVSGDFGRLLVEVKSSYVLQNRDTKIKSKNEAVKIAVENGLADSFVLVTEKSCLNLFGFRLPTSTQQRKNLFEKVKGKVVFHSNKFEEKYYGKAS